MAQEDRRRRGGMVESFGGARDERSQADQSAARLLGTLAAIAGQLHHRGRLRLGRELVCARSEGAPRHDGIALGKSGHDGTGRAVRHRREVCLPGPRGDRHGR